MYTCNLEEEEEELHSFMFRSRNTIFPDRQPIVKHTYYLRNRGPSALQQANLTIYWPERTIENRPLFELIAQPNIRVINQIERVPQRNSIRQQTKDKTNFNQIPISVHCEHIELNAIVSIVRLDN